MLPVAVARSFSDDNTMLRTSGFIDDFMFSRMLILNMGCQSAGGNAQKRGASALQLCPSLRCRLLTSLDRKPRRIQRSLAMEAHEGATSAILDCLVESVAKKRRRHLADYERTPDGVTSA